MTPFVASIPSPPQGVWHLGPFPLRAYALCIIVGIIVGVLWGNRLYVARGGVPGRIADLAVFAVPFGLVGGRLYHVITDHARYFGPGENPWKAFAIWDGGLGIWGAVALGALGIWIGCRHYRIPMAPVADALAAPLVIAQAIGRLGNYFNQELFGSSTSLPWGLDVYLRTPGGVAGTLAQCSPDGSAPEFPTDYLKAAPEVLCGVYHPTFLYELIWDVLVAALVVWADRRFRLGGGRVFALYVAGYTAGRGWIEYLRIDPALTRVFGLRVNVVVSIVIFLLAVLYLVARRCVGREDPSVVAGTGPDAHPDTEGTTDVDSGSDSGDPVLHPTADVQRGAGDSPIAANPIDADQESQHVGTPVQGDGTVAERSTVALAKRNHPASELPVSSQNDEMDAPGAGEVIERVAEHHED